MHACAKLHESKKALVRQNFHQWLLDIHLDIIDYTSRNKHACNRSGSTANLKPGKFYGKSELQEIRRNLSYHGADQVVVKRGSTVNWDGRVRNSGTRKSYLSAPRTRGKEALGDVHTRQLKAEPFTFLE